MKQEIASELVTPGEAVAMPLSVFKTGLRVDNEDEDEYLETLMVAATQQAESFLQVALVRQTRVLRYNGTPPRDLKLDFGPVQRITHVKYDDVNGVEQVLDSDLYTLRNDVLSPTFSGDWPFATERWPGSFRVTYEAGLVDDTESPVVGEVPARVKTAIILYGQSLYDKNPQTTETLNKTAERLLDTVRRGMGV